MCQARASAQQQALQQSLLSQRSMVDEQHESELAAQLSAAKDQLQIQEKLLSELAHTEEQSELGAELAAAYDKLEVQAQQMEGLLAELSSVKEEATQLGLSSTALQVTLLSSTALAG